MRLIFFTRICSSLISASTNKNLYYIHEVLRHTGIMRHWYFIKSKSLPYSLSDTRKTCQNYNTCAEVQRRFYRKPIKTLISATQPWQRISLHFKGPVKYKNNYLSNVIDE